MWYIFLQGNVVLESFPSDSPDFPGVPIEDRFPPDIVAQLRQWGEDVPIGWVWDEESNAFKEPAVSEIPIDPGDPIDPDVSERLAALERSFSDMENKIEDILTEIRRS